MTTLEQIQRAVDYMEEHIAQELTNEEIAGQAFLSSFHFQRIFSILSGCTVGEYLRNRRLSLAAEELLRTDQSILEIALRFGYSTPEGFCRAFHRQFGLAPSAARSRKGSLPRYEKLQVQNIMTGGNREMDDMSRYSSRGYYVKENAPVYFTEDMDRTCKWFQDVLGWYGDVCARDESGAGEYGCVFDYPGELIVANLTPFRGIHLFRGAPKSGEVVGFLCIQGIEAFYRCVRGSGWDKITEITQQPWGALECDVTTVDGSILRFFEATQ